MTNRSNYFPAIDTRAHALRLVRIAKKQNELVYYEAFWFPKNPNGCEVALKRARICGSLTMEESPFCVDVLDANEDIIQELTVEKRVFDYLKRKYKVRRERLES